MSLGVLNKAAYKLPDGLHLLCIRCTMLKHFAVRQQATFRHGITGISPFFDITCKAGQRAAQGCFTPTVAVIEHFTIRYKPLVFSFSFCCPEMYADFQYEVVRRNGDLLQGHSNQSAEHCLGASCHCVWHRMYANLDHEAV